MVGRGGKVTILPTLGEDRYRDGEGEGERDWNRAASKGVGTQREAQEVDEEEVCDEEANDGAWFSDLKLRLVVTVGWLGWRQWQQLLNRVVCVLLAATAPPAVVRWVAHCVATR
jgi:hypothetical protein